MPLNHIEPLLRNHQIKFIDLRFSDLQAFRAATHPLEYQLYYAI